MAWVGVFRLAVKLEQIGHRVVVGEQSGQAEAQHEALRWARDRLRNPGESDAALSDALSDRSGNVMVVATYTGDFVLRKAQIIFSQQDALVASEDARVVTMHFAKISGGAVVDTWDAADFSTLVTALDAWWTAIKDRFTAQVKYDRVKIYKDGPGIVPPNPPVYDVEKDVAGTNTGFQLPPQVAVSVTEIAGSKLNWGRFYLPAPDSAVLDAYGRLATAASTDFADATDTLYETCKTAGLHPVVYRAPLPVREKKNGVELPARDASAWDVEKIQIDDIFDVIRSRRFKQPLLRTQRALS